MTKRYEDRTFDMVRDQNSAAIFEDMDFHKCEFDDVHLSVTRNPALRSTIRNVSLTNCKLRSLAINSAVLDTVLVDTLRCSMNVSLTSAAAYRHVEMRGNIGPIMLTASVRDEKAQPLFDTANAAFYEDVDWALDISRAEFTGETQIDGIPAHLLVRDPETQVIVPLARAEAIDWSGLDLGKSGWRVMLDDLVQEQRPFALFVAAKKSRKFDEEMRAIVAMREAGLLTNAYDGERRRNS